MRSKTSRVSASFCVALAIGGSLNAEVKPYSEDFSGTPVGQVPESIMVLDGQFAVKEEDGGKFLELPGSPLETFGVLFGGSETNGVVASARVLATKSGRKFPTFDIGLNGVGGFKVRVAPGKKAIELVKGDEIRTSTPMDWKSGEWTHLRIRSRWTATGLVIEGKAWQGGAEPEAWPIQTTEKEPLPPGKAGVWGMPFAGTPIRFDDLQLKPLP